jgi:uncharacterized protein (TIGR03435 family)
MIMNLIRRIGLSFLCVALLSQSNLFGQSFDVASVKPSAPDSHTETRRWPGGRFTATGITLRALMQRAWDVQDFQIVGGPKWIDNDRFDIDARARLDDTAKLNTLIQALLAERFHLKVHQETRTTLGYSLVAAKRGIKLTRNPTSGASTWSLFRGNLVAKNASMDMLASDILQKALHRPVVNNTGLDGTFDLKLTWAPDDDTSVEAEPLPSFFTAVREELGLELKPHPQQAVVFVIESVEKPSAN